MAPVGVILENGIHSDLEIWLKLESPESVRVEGEHINYLFILDFISQKVFIMA